MHDDFFSIPEINALPFYVFSFDNSNICTGCNLEQIKAFQNLESTANGLRQEKNFDISFDSVRGKSIDYLSEEFHWPRDTTEKVTTAVSSVLRENRIQFSIQRLIDVKKYERELFVCYVPVKKPTGAVEMLGFAIELNIVRDYRLLFSESSSISMGSAPEFAEYIINFTNNNIINAEEILLYKKLKLTSVNISRRELACIKLLARGMKNHHVAISLNLSRRTVESYIINARDKLACKNSVELVFKCAKLGLI